MVVEINYEPSLTFFLKKYKKNNINLFFLSFPASLLFLLIFLSPLSMDNNIPINQYANLWEHTLDHQNL